jgi:2-oxoglutarate ferredoxin oxidoreductase subunit alpha
MVRLRAQKVANIAADIPELQVDDPDGASLLILGWGGTYGPITAAVRRLRRDGKQVAQAHLTHLNPFPRNTGDVLRSYDRVLVPEMNLGQLLKLVRAEFLVDAVGYNQDPRPRAGDRDGARALPAGPLGLGRERRRRRALDRR